MKIEKFIKRYTRAIFLVLIVMMVLSLVLWGYMGGRQTEPEEAKKIAGEIDGVKITLLEFNKVRWSIPIFITIAGFLEGGIWSWLDIVYAQEASRIRAKKYEEELRKLISQGKSKKEAEDEAKRIADSYTDEVAKRKLTWWLIVLKIHAQRLGIKTDAQEIKEKLEQMCRNIRAPNMDEFKKSMLRQLPIRRFEEFVEVLGDYLMIRKVLRLHTESKFKMYSDIFDEVQTDFKKSVKFSYVQIDKDRYIWEIRDWIRKSPGEISKWYKRHKDKFKEPKKIKVEGIYLTFESLREYLPGPSEDEIKDYYEKNKDREFLISRPGEPEKRYMPLQFAKSTIIKNIKIKKAKPIAMDYMRNIAKQIRSEELSFIDAQKKYTKDIYEIKHFVKTISKDKIGELEERIGIESGLSQKFDTFKKGDISRLIKTDKASLIYKILDVIPEKQIGLIEPVKEQIRKELEKEKLVEKMLNVAEKISSRIKNEGFNYVSLIEEDLNFRQSDYVCEGDTFGNLQFEVCEKLIKQAMELKPGEASDVDAGEQRVFVIYVHDKIINVDDEWLSKIKDRRQKWIEVRKREYFGRILKKIFDFYNLKDMIKGQEQGAP